jgi:hypothetical protein
VIFVDAVDDLNIVYMLGLTFSNLFPFASTQHGSCECDGDYDMRDVTP